MHTRNFRTGHGLETMCVPLLGPLEKSLIWKNAIPNRVGHCPIGCGFLSRKGLIVIVVVVVLVAVLMIAAILSTLDSETEVPLRSDTIPADVAKGTPATDYFKPVLHLDDWEDPVPMSGPINTAGAEDSPFITPDGNRFFFFFTPDVRVPAEKQLLDKVTGIWWSQKVGSVWTEPEKIILNDDLALDGAEFVLGDTLWFASIRAGNYGEIDIFTAQYEEGEWGNVENAGSQLNVDYDIGEFHLTADGNTIYFHTGNLGYGENMDLWTTNKVAGGWSQPVKVPDVNTDSTEGYPFLTQDGSELWYTGTSKLGYTGPAIFRCIKNGSGWDPAVEVLSNFAGECTMDSEGNLYFVHHYFSSNLTMLEADIYVAYHKSSSRSASAASIEVDPGLAIPAFGEDIQQQVSIASRYPLIASGQERR
ncbi:MAG: hypothetical protein A3K60_02725 [Euryarchaeota archaeon RBG_19FT_COMBO_56_21]|nr:MAG: hypothetical protein A3K60_02725 [Euryarchaeota archaeon RBG_19FT_COMBO_56_21]